MPAANVVGGEAVGGVAAEGAAGAAGEKEVLQLWQSELERLKAQLTSARAAQSMAPLELACLFLTEHAGFSAPPPNAPKTLLFGNEGAPFIEEELLGMRFRVDPGAFFQVNTTAAEVLYSTVRDWVAADKNTVVVDVCCGTGSIGPVSV